MNCATSLRNIFLLFLFMLAVGFLAGSCSKNSGSSGDGKDNNNTGNIDPKNGSPADDKPAQEKEACGSCHEEQLKFWAYGEHSSVTCKTCHGVDGDHTETETAPLVRGNDQCIECHDLVEGAPAGKMSGKEVLEYHLKAVEKKHVIKVKREKIKGRCVYCHDPHLGQ